MERTAEPRESEGYEIPKDLAPLEGKSVEARVTTGALRCPFCRTDVDVAGIDWVACHGCLARHHDSCWAESKRCASCGTKRLLRPVGRVSALIEPLLHLSKIALTLCIAILVLFAGYAGARLSQSRELPPPPVVVAPPAPVVAAPVDPRAPIRAVFATRSSFEVRFTRPDGSFAVRAWNNAYFDEYCDGLRSLVLDGDRLVNPSPQDAARYLSKVLELYRQDHLEGDVFLTEEALRKLGAQLSRTSLAGSPDKSPGNVSFRDPRTNEPFRFALEREGEAEVADMIEFWVSVCGLEVTSPKPSEAIGIIERVRAIADADGRTADVARFDQALERLRARAR